MSLVTLGPRRLNLDRGTLLVEDGSVLRLTPNETRLLRYLAEREDRTVSVDELLREVWEYSARSRTRTVVTTVHRLRKKVEPDPAEPKYLLRDGDGYRLSVGGPPDLHARAPVSLYGRATLLTSLRTWDDPVVTLIGPGGVGKTRLAEALAHERSLPVVRLGGVSDYDTLLARLAAALDLSIRPGDDPLDRVMATLGPRSHLVLDECEHCLDSVRTFLLEVRKSSPDTQVLTTSRRPIGLVGERVVRVHGLDTGAAVALLRHTADLAFQGWSDRAGPGELEQIVEAVDGHPLSIELAAGRARLFSPTDLLQQLDRPLTLLRGDVGRRPEHAALEATLDGSWELLDAFERAVLCQLAVFAGSFDATAAEAVVEIDSDRWVVDILGQLVDDSLVRSWASVTHATHFGLATPVREYASKRADPVVLEAARARHVDHFARRCQSEWQRRRLWPGNSSRHMVEELHQALHHAQSDEQRGWLAWVVGWAVPPSPSFLALLDSLIDQPLSSDLRCALRMVRGVVSHRPSQVLADLQTELEDAGSSRNALAVVVLRMGDSTFSQDIEDADRVVTRARALGDPVLLSGALRIAGNKRLHAARIAGAGPLYEEAMAITREHQMPIERYRTLTNYAVCVAMRGELDRAVELLTESRTALEALGAWRSAAVCWLQGGLIDHLRGELRQARETLATARDRLRRAGNRLYAANASAALAGVWLDLGETSQALDDAEVAQAAYGEKLRHLRDPTAARLVGVLARFQSGERGVHRGLQAEESAVCQGWYEVLEAYEDGRAPSRAVPHAETATSSQAEPAGRLWLGVSAAWLAVGNPEEALRCIEAARARWQTLNARLGLSACDLGSALARGECEPADLIESQMTRFLRGAASVAPPAGHSEAESAPDPN